MFNNCLPGISFAIIHLQCRSYVDAVSTSFQVFTGSEDFLQVVRKHDRIKTPIDTILRSTERLIATSTAKLVITNTDIYASIVS